MKQLLLIVYFITCFHLSGEDWPAYRYDSSRSGSSYESISSALKLSWVYKSLNKPVPAWPGQDSRMKSDFCFQPVSSGGLLYWGNSANGKIYAADLATGEIRWKFATGGPVRFAPLCWKNRLYFASDDGFLYCLNRVTGKQLWKFRAGPQNSFLAGNNHLISRWPVRGAPVIRNGKIYFAAGVWPAEGIYIYSLDAETSQVLWCNDTSRKKMPSASKHSFSETPKISGVTANGYLALSGSHLLVPCGRSVPAVLDVGTGAYEDFYFINKIGGGDICILPALNTFVMNDIMHELPSNKSLNGGFGSLVVNSKSGLLSLNKGFLVRNHCKYGEGFDRKGNNVKKLIRKEEKIAQLNGNFYSLIASAGKAFAGGENKVVVVDLKSSHIQQLKVDGGVYGLAISNGSLIVSTDKGDIYVFSSFDSPSKVIVEEDVKAEKGSGALVKNLNNCPLKQGYALINGADREILEELVSGTDYNLIFTGTQLAMEKLKSETSHLSEYGVKFKILTGSYKEQQFSRHMFSIIVDFENAISDRKKALLNPFGGSYIDKRGVVHKVEELKGEGEWTHQHGNASNIGSSDDTILKGPLGIRWYNDFHCLMPDRHGMPPSPLYYKGLMFLQGLNEILCVDAFSGREVWRKTYKERMAYINRSKNIGANYSGSRMVAGGGFLFAVLEEKCLKLDLKSGKLVKEILLPDEGRWGFIAFDKGILYGGLAHSFKSHKSEYAGGDLLQSKKLYAFDPSSGKTIWTLEADTAFRHNAISICEGRVFLIDSDFDPKFIAQADSARRRGLKAPLKKSVLKSLNASTGELLWQKSQDVYGTMLLSDKNSGTLLMGYYIGGWTKYGDNRKDITAFDLITGKKKWEASVRGALKYGKRSSRTVIQGGHVIAEPNYFNISDGKKIEKTFYRPGTGCSTVIFSPNILAARSDVIGYAGREESAPWKHYEGVRPGCSTSIIIGGGMLLVPDLAENCVCSYKFKASLSLGERAADPEYEIHYSDKEAKVLVKDFSDIHYQIGGLPVTDKSPRLTGKQVFPRNCRVKLRRFSRDLPPSETVVVDVK